MKTYTPAIIGMGSVGSGWATLMLAKGMTVHAFDPAKGSEERSRDLISQAWSSIVQMGLSKAEEPPFQYLKFYKTIANTVQDVDVILENVPETLALKQSVITEIEETAKNDALILSSAGGIMPSSLQDGTQHPQRIAVMHPFNPSHLIPLVEIVPGEKTSDVTIQKTLEFARYLGKQPIVISKEQSGHMVNRLQFALMHEAIRCLTEGVASASDIDAALRYGLAPRWLLMGGLHTLALAGGAGGMAGILDMAGPAIETWWKPLGEVKITKEIKEQLVKAEAELNKDKSFEDWVSWRDSALVNVFDLQSNADREKPKK